MGVFDLRLMSNVVFGLLLFSHCCLASAGLWRGFCVKFGELIHGGVRGVRSGRKHCDYLNLLTAAVKGWLWHAGVRLSHLSPITSDMN